MPPSADGTSSSAATTRAVRWLLGGLVLTALAVVAMAPELLGDLSGLGGVALLAVAAGLPGLLVVLVVAARRRRGGDPAGPDGPGERTGPPAHDPGHGS